MSDLNAARLRELLHYDRESGLFNWLQQNEGCGRRRNNPAGTADAEGYVSITIDGRCYFAHRLAVLYETGAWPEQQVDHIDG